MAFFSISQFLILSKCNSQNELILITILDIINIHFIMFYFKMRKRKKNIFNIWFLFYFSYSSVRLEKVKESVQIIQLEASFEWRRIVIVRCRFVSLPVDVSSWFRSKIMFAVCIHKFNKVWEYTKLYEAMIKLVSWKPSDMTLLNYIFMKYWTIWGSMLCQIVDWFKINNVLENPQLQPILHAQPHLPPSKLKISQIWIITQIHKMRRYNFDGFNALSIVKLMPLLHFSNQTFTSYWINKKTVTTVILENGSWLFLRCIYDMHKS